MNRRNWFKTAIGGLCAAVLAPRVAPVRAGGGIGVAMEPIIEDQYGWVELRSYGLTPGDPIAFPIEYRINPDMQEQP